MPLKPELLPDDLLNFDHSEFDKINPSFNSLRNELYKLLKRDWKYKLFDIKYKLGHSKLKKMTVTQTEIDLFIENIHLDKWIMKVNEHFIMHQNPLKDRISNEFNILVISNLIENNKTTIDDLSFRWKE